MLLAEAAALQAAYCRAIDDRDADLLRSLVTHDVAAVGADGVPRTGAGEFVALFERYWATGVTALHFVSNVEVLGADVRMGGGTPVEVRALFHAVSRVADGPLVRTWGRYRDHVTRAAQGGLVFTAKRISVVHRG